MPKTIEEVIANYHTLYGTAVGELAEEVRQVLDEDDEATLDEPNGPEVFERVMDKAIETMVSLGWLRPTNKHPRSF
jgi:hypothetical protein